MPAALLFLGAWGDTRASGANWTVELGGLLVEGAALEGARAELHLALEEGHEDALTVRVDRLSLPAGMSDFRAIRLDCRPARLHSGGMLCTRLQAGWQHELLPQQGISGLLQLELGGRVDLQLQDIELAGGRAQLHFVLSDQDWRLDIEARGLEAGDFKKLLQNSDLKNLLLPLADLSTAGNFDIVLHARGSGPATRHLEGRLDWHAGAFADDEGRLAGEDIHASLSWLMQSPGAGQWQGRFSLNWDQGGAYVHPAYIEAGLAQPISLAGHVRWTNGTLVMDELLLEWGDRLALSGMGRIDTRRGPAGLDADVQLHHLRFPGAYDDLLQMFLYGTPLADMQTQGEISGRLRIAAGRLVAAGLIMDDIHLDDRQGRLGLYGLDGRLDWDASASSQPSRLEWSGGHIYRVPLGAAYLAIQTHPDGFRMMEPAVIPILDGSLRLDSLSAVGLAEGRPILELDALVTPIAMTQLAAHLNMPSFTGTLAGSLPGARFEQGRLSMDGVLRIAAFDGEIRIANPSLDDPFGVAPVLTADMEIVDLDLAAVTSTFAFGLIEGILRGHVHDLVLVNWQPVNFDAALYTPLDRRFRRRISQRALDNLVSVGGGPGGALSLGLLRFFDSFGYHQLGVSCRLRGDICEMNGVAPAGDGPGYYIVRGSGLPRVEVIGHTRNVAWRDLLTRLQAALDNPELSSGTPPDESGPEPISLMH